MPFAGLGLHIIIAIFFAIHALRRGQNMYWLFVLFAFPALGSIVYFVVIYLPELRDSRGGVQAKRAIRQWVDPNRLLREARAAYELVPTVDNRLKLANALLENDLAEEALALYREAANGPFARDPALLSGLARAQFVTGRHAESLATLATLFEARPDTRRQAAIALLYARALAATQHADARSAFELALTVASDPEPKCRYADWLASQADAADRQRAVALYDEVVKDSRHWHHHAKTINKVWLRHAQAGLEKIGRA